MAMSACGGTATPEPEVAEPTASSATSEGAPVAATETSAETGGGSPDAAATDTPATTPVAPPLGKRAPCTLGQDQTCNGDPSVSAIWGKCTEGGTCECNAGFTLAPTGYCQPQK